MECFKIIISFRVIFLKMAAIVKIKLVSYNNSGKLIQVNHLVCQLLRIQNRVL